MADEFEIIDVWLCRFPSKADADAYFEENYDEVDDECPISPFAADMDQVSYDHDFMERGEFHDPPMNDAGEAIAPSSFSSSYHAAVVQAFRLRPFAPFNCVLLVWNREIEKPISVDKPGRTLHYLGRFDCDPAAD